MTPRSIRRAAERKALKLARKAARLAENAPASEIPEPPTRCPERSDGSAISAAQLAANRANAQHSTGPKTPEGKVSSSRNSLKHGLASGEMIIPGEDRAAFAALLHDLIGDHQPVGVTEEMLVQQMAQAYWLAQRAIRFQNDCFTENGLDEKRLSLFLRYQSTYDRAFHKALAGLLRLQKERRETGVGFVSQNPPCEAPEQPTQSPERSDWCQAGIDPALIAGFVSQNPLLNATGGALQTGRAA